MKQSNLYLLFLFVTLLSSSVHLSAQDLTGITVTGIEVTSSNAQEVAPNPSFTGGNE